jgi:hypothetical protein
MSFDMPPDDDLHGECRYEIQMLQTRLAEVQGHPDDQEKTTSEWLADIGLDRATASIRRGYLVRCDQHLGGCFVSLLPMCEGSRWIVLAILQTRGEVRRLIKLLDLPLNPLL